jgi:phosphoribosyl-ATP pyrophosphohydrolase
MAALVRHDTETALPLVCGREVAGIDQIARLYRALDHVSGAEHPRTARLLAGSRRKIAQKLMEEAGEVAIEAVRHRAPAIIRESADLVYQLVVLWHECGVAPEEVWTEMRRRADTLGIAEKLPKAVPHDDEMGRPE